MEPIYMALGPRDTVQTYKTNLPGSLTPGMFIKLHERHRDMVMKILRETATHKGFHDFEISFDVYGNPLIASKKRIEEERADMHRKEGEMKERHRQLEAQISSKDAQIASLQSASNNEKKRAEVDLLSKTNECLKLEHHVGTYKTENASLKKELDNKNRENNTLMEILEESQRQIEELNKTIRDLEAKACDSYGQIKELNKTIRQLEMKTCNAQEQITNQIHPEQIKASAERIYKDVWSYETLALLMRNQGYSLDPFVKGMDKLMSHSEAVEIARNFYENGAIIPALSGNIKCSGHKDAFDVNRSKLKSCACCEKRLGDDSQVRLFYMSSARQHCSECDTPPCRVVCVVCVENAKDILKVIEKWSDE